MAITSAQLQTALGTNPRNATVIREWPAEGTGQQWYVEGREDARGRARMCNTTASDNAATQAASVLSTLRA